MSADRRRMRIGCCCFYRHLWTSLVGFETSDELDIHAKTAVPTHAKRSLCSLVLRSCSHARNPSSNSAVKSEHSMHVVETRCPKPVRDGLVPNLPRAGRMMNEGLLDLPCFFFAPKHPQPAVSCAEPRHSLIGVAAVHSASGETIHEI